MVDSPTLAVVLYTYNRREYAHRTLRSALERLHYHGRTIVHIADDGSPDGYREELERLAGGFAQVAAVSSSNAERGGYGRSYNLASQHVHGAADVVLCLEDDWELARPLDLDPLVEALQDPRIGCIRLGYIGYTQALHGEFAFVGGNHYLVLDSLSPEPHVFAGHPRLETVAWQRRVGPWPEGATAGATEFEVAHRLMARRDVAWPIDLVPPRGDLFVHIGTERAQDDLRPVDGAMVMA